jgi:tetratricopeptide repeat protein 8
MSHIDPLWHALSKLRRGKYAECIAICDEVLASNPNDQVIKSSYDLYKAALKTRLTHLQAAWMAKCRAVIKQNYIDDIEMDEEGVAEMLLDENALASMPRCAYRQYLLPDSLLMLVHT